MSEFRDALVNYHINRTMALIHDFEEAVESIGDSNVTVEQAREITRIEGQIHQQVRALRDDWVATKPRRKSIIQQILSK